MPAPSRWLIRSSFICLLTGMIIGALLLVHKAYPFHPASWSLLPVHIELLVFGWIIQFTMGTAYWILPRYLESTSRGNVKVAILMVVLLHLGMLFVIVDGLANSLSLVLVGRIMETTSVFLFVGLHWQRIVTYNS